MPGTPASSHGFGLDRQSRDNNAFRVITVADFTAGVFTMGPTDRGIRVDLTGCEAQGYTIILPHPAEVGGQVFSIWYDQVGNCTGLTIDDTDDCRIPMAPVTLTDQDDTGQFYSDGLYYLAMQVIIGGDIVWPPQVPQN